MFLHHSLRKKDAQRLVDYFSSAEVADTIAATGLEPMNAE
jgi:hypothetical protein